MLNVEEQHAYVAAGVASAVSVLFDRFGLNTTINGVADSIFEGDRDQASTLTGGVLIALGVVVTYLVVRTEVVDDYLGVVLAALATAHFAMGGLALLDN